MTPPPGGRGPGRGGPPRPPSARAERLLWEITVRPLDPGYGARATPSRDGGPGTRAAAAAVALALAAAGIGVGAAAAQLRVVPLPAASERAQLEGELDRRIGLADELAARNGDARTRIEALQAEALGADDEALTDAVAALSVGAAAVAVAGPGVRVTLDDAPDAGDDIFADPAANGGTTVIDVDVQQVVNGLWAAGAEGVAVNGLRLTSLSAIRGAGDAITVDYRPLARPYTVEAVGDPAALQAELATGGTSSFVAVLRGVGIRVGVDEADRVDLPAGTAAVLQHAVPVEVGP